MYPRFSPDFPSDLELPPAVMTREVPEMIEWLKALRCLAAVVAHGSTTRAGEAIHLSQSAVTRSIQGLERHIGQTLFDRGARGMVPTKLGTRVTARITQLQELLTLGAAEALQLAVPAQRGPRSPERFAAVAAPASLKALFAVAAWATESRAATALGISQPAVHRALSVLEDACGVSLYVKSARSTRLTDSGDALLRRVKLAVAELRAMEVDIAAWRGEMRGRIIVGALPLSVHLALPQAVAAVRQRHSEIQITVVDGTYESLMHQLCNADVDIVVGALRPTPGPEVVQESLFSDDLAVVARPDHPCFAYKVPTLALLQQWSWVVPLPATPARSALERAFGEQGLALPNDYLQATSAQFTRTIVAHTDHLAFASRGQAREDERAGILRIVPVAMCSTSRDIGIALRGGGEPSVDLLALVESLREASARFRMVSR